MVVTSSNALRHGSHSFTCKLHHACLYSQPQSIAALWLHGTHFTVPRRVVGWVDLLVRPVTCRCIRSVIFQSCVFYARAWTGHQLNDYMRQWGCRVDRPSCASLSPVRFHHLEDFVIGLDCHTHASALPTWITALFLDISLRCGITPSYVNINNSNNLHISFYIFHILRAYTSNSLRIKATSAN